jgi:gamma-glutamylcyclotransferase (GGCT)/AIG2-like uncharacterized protein YtfP
MAHADPRKKPPQDETHRAIAARIRNLRPRTCSPERACYTDSRYDVSFFHGSIYSLLAGRIECMSARYYFAYGSNMDGGQMRRRCPDANCVGVGMIPGWKFRINTRGVATIVPDDESTVYGIVWSLSKADEQSLDRYEGVSLGLYSKAPTEARLKDGAASRHFYTWRRTTNLGPAGRATWTASWQPPETIASRIPTFGSCKRGPRQALDFYSQVAHQGTRGRRRV